MHHFSALTWLQRLCGVRHAEEPPSTPWERYPAPQERNIPCVIHQREQPEYQPEPERPFLAWRDHQPVLRPRLITDTGPKIIERAGHEQAIEPVIVRKVDTEGIRKVKSPHTPIPEARKLAPSELPDFLQAKVPGLPSGALPVQRSRDLLATMRIKDRVAPSNVGELPTTPTTHQAIVSSLLPPLGPWEAQPEPTNPPSGWLTDGPQVEFWQGPEIENAPPETDAEIPTQKLAPEQRKLMTRNEPTAPDEIPTLRYLARMAAQKKVSEK